MRWVDSSGAEPSVYPSVRGVMHSMPISALLAPALLLGGCAPSGSPETERPAAAASTAPPTDPATNAGATAEPPVVDSVGEAQDPQVDLTPPPLTPEAGRSITGARNILLSFCTGHRAGRVRSGLGRSERGRPAQVEQSAVRRPVFGSVRDHRRHCAGNDRRRGRIDLLHCADHDYRRGRKRASGAYGRRGRAAPRERCRWCHRRAASLAFRDAHARLDPLAPAEGTPDAAERQSGGGTRAPISSAPRASVRSPSGRSRHRRGRGRRRSAMRRVGTARVRPGRPRRCRAAGW
jgi:hypothetical protein